MPQVLVAQEQLLEQLQVLGVLVEVQQLVRERVQVQVQVQVRSLVLQ
jgi:hypothetical protein